MSSAHDDRVRPHISALRSNIRSAGDNLHAAITALQRVDYYSAQGAEAARRIKELEALRDVMEQAWTLVNRLTTGDFDGPRER